MHPKAIYNAAHAIPHHGAIRRKVAVENFIIYETLAPGRIFEQTAGQTIPPPLKDNMQNTAKCIDGAREALELDPACHRQSPLKGDYNHPDKTTT